MLGNQLPRTKNPEPSTIIKLNCHSLNQIVTTSDGSHTIFVSELNEHYHSVHGAVQESKFIFINNGFETCNADPLNIFEVGFGTGLNALLTALKSIPGQRIVNYTTIEKYPLEEEIVKGLNHYIFAGEGGSTLFNSIHHSPWNEWISICKNFNLNKINEDFTAGRQAGMYDLIYFDAFGPDKQPEMWTSKMFAFIASITKINGIFVTYSAKG